MVASVSGGFCRRFPMRHAGAGGLAVRTLSRTLHECTHIHLRIGLRQLAGRNEGSEAQHAHRAHHAANVLGSGSVSMSVYASMTPHLFLCTCFGSGWCRGHTSESTVASMRYCPGWDLQQYAWVCHGTMPNPVTNYRTERFSVSLESVGQPARRFSGPMGAQLDVLRNGRFVRCPSHTG